MKQLYIIILSLIVILVMTSLLFKKNINIDTTKTQIELMINNKNELTLNKYLSKDEIIDIKFKINSTTNKVRVTLFTNEKKIGVIEN